MPTALPGVRVDFLGCSDAFSTTGRSTCYRLWAGSQNFLLDTGAPLFNLLNEQELGDVTGVLGTHSHDDHRRWLTDFALYRFYRCRQKPKLQLITTDWIHEEYQQTAGNALDRTLSFDSRRVVDVPYSYYFDVRSLGPRQKFNINSKDGQPRVVDSAGVAVPPGVAKVIVNPSTRRQRLLFKDPESQAWVEPEVYYGFNGQAFYEADTRPYLGAECKFHAIKSHAWHGVPVIGIVMETERERLVFSSDTAFNPDLFAELSEARLSPKRAGMSPEQFESASVIHGDMNDFVERIWSAGRLQEALEAYRGAVVFHDTAPFRSVVHTDYLWTKKINSKLVLVHTPDRFVSTDILAQNDKSLRVVGNDVFEQVGDRLLALDAAVYICDAARFYVGFADDTGEHILVEKEHGLLDVVPADQKTDFEVLRRIRLYEDVDGGYFPILRHPSESYRRRPDGRVERVQFTPTGSIGSLTEPIPRQPRV